MSPRLVTRPVRKSLADTGARVGALTPCGGPGTRQEVLAPAQHATGIVQGDSGEIGHLHSDTPSEVHVALAGTTANNTPFVVAWRVATQQRDSLRADEAHFLSSIRCH